MSYYVVIGAVNMDIGGTSSEALIPEDSNPGKVFMSAGGVGRNIAHNMKLLGLDVCFVSAFGQDLYGDQLRSHLDELGIDAKDSLYTKEAATSVYLFITDETGDMKLAVNDMKIYELLTPAYVSQYLDKMNQAAAVLIDTNIPEETITYLGNHLTVPIFADPVSCKKAVRLLPVIDKLHTICPNRMEAEILSGVKIETDADLLLASQRLIEKGIKRVFITMGGEGIFCADGREYFQLPAIPTRVVNTTGAGDAFAASLAYSLEMEYPLKRSAVCGQAAASIAIQSIDTINPLMSREKIKQLINENGGNV